MASEEDNFDIDIYGDGDETGLETGQETAGNATGFDGANDVENEALPDAAATDTAALQDRGQPANDLPQKIETTGGAAGSNTLPKQAPQTQGLKQEDEAVDERPLDPGATAALLVSELDWWINDDDIRGWANQSRCEDELEEVTFSEHKVNGKSKGQAYVLFRSPQAATATKRKVDEAAQQGKTFTIMYTNPLINQFKTLPKDGPGRNNYQNNARGNNSSFGSHNSGQGNTGYNNNNSTGFRGGRGGFNNRGGGMNNMNGFNRGGFNQTGGFNNGMRGGMQNNNMGGMQPYGGFQNQAGMMGGMRGAMNMRGGRGMMGMPMGGMGFNPMAMGMNMPNLANMGMSGNFGMFNQQQQQGGGNDGSWNPHGAKRSRQE